MKQRITYLLPEGSRVDPADIKVEPESLKYTKAHEANQEWRLTLGLDDLPDEVQLILRDCHELHIRWTSPVNRRLVAPFVSRLPTGLHAFFTPRQSAREAPVCDLLRYLVGKDGTRCYSVADTFSRSPILSERFSASSTYQFYSLSVANGSFRDTFLNKLCNTRNRISAACYTQLNDLQDASYIDIDFDAISHALVFTAYWSVRQSGGLASGQARRGIWDMMPFTEGRIEVGVLQPEQATEPEELSLGGYLTEIRVVGRPKLTLFSFPSRHHPLPAASLASFTAAFHQPTGLHPKFEITLLGQHLTPPKDTCGLHAYWTLPSALFIDRYQLSDPLFLASQNLIALHSLGGEQDLEAPDWVVKRWGSAALFQLAVPRSQVSGVILQAKNWTVTIQTHLRYLDGRQDNTDSSDKSTVDVPWPVVFWACEAEEGLKMSTNPFDRVNLGYDGLFGPKTMFYHIPPDPNVSTTVSQIGIPVLNPENAAWVQSGTLAAVAIGFSWVCWQLLRSVGSDRILRNRKHKRQ